MKKTVLFSNLRSVLLVFKNGLKRDELEKQFYEIVGLDLRREIQLCGFADIEDPDFLRNSKNMITICYGRFFGVPAASQQPIYNLINETAVRQRKRSRAQKIKRNSSNSRKYQICVNSKFADISAEEERQILAELESIFNPEQFIEKQ